MFFCEKETFLRLASPELAVGEAGATYWMSHDLVCMLSFMCARVHVFVCLWMYAYVHACICAASGEISRERSCVDV